MLHSLAPGCGTVGPSSLQVLLGETTFCELSCYVSVVIIIPYQRLSLYNQHCFRRCFPGVPTTLCGSFHYHHLADERFPASRGPVTHQIHMEAAGCQDSTTSSQTVRIAYCLARKTHGFYHRLSCACTRVRLCLLHLFQGIKWGNTCKALRTVSANNKPHINVSHIDTYVPSPDWVMNLWVSSPL